MYFGGEQQYISATDWSWNMAVTAQPSWLAD